MYNRKKSLLGVYRYILKHIIWLNRVLTNLKCAGYTISSIKSYFCKDKIIIVGYCYNGKGRYLKELKVTKIIY